MNLTKKYIPCVRWKLGEYQAISKLLPSTKASLFPIIEVPEYNQNLEFNFDFELGKLPKTLDHHLNLFIERIIKKWGDTNFFLDTSLIPFDQVLDNKRNPVEYIFSDLGKKSVQFTPVIHFNDPQVYKYNLHRHLQETNNNICLRVTLDEFTNDEFDTNANNLINSYQRINENSSLIIDLRDINFEPIDIFSNLLINIMKKRRLDNWGLLGLIGTSFPQSLSGISQGLTIIKRDEWRLYKVLYKKLVEQEIRVPVFGDYSINNPRLLLIDPRVLKPKANIRYTIKDNWLIIRGENLRDYKYTQYKNLCELLINSPYYCGKSFSYGDDYIFRCANGIAKTGSLSTWREIGTNHHIETVVRELAMLGGS